MSWELDHIVSLSYMYVFVFLLLFSTWAYGSYLRYTTPHPYNSFLLLYTGSQECTSQSSRFQVSYNTATSLPLGISLVDETSEEKMEESVQSGQPFSQELVKGVKFAYSIPTEQHSDTKQVHYTCLLFSTWYVT